MTVSDGRIVELVRRFQRRRGEANIGLALGAIESAAHLEGMETEGVMLDICALIENLTARCDEDTRA